MKLYMIYDAIEGFSECCAIWKAPTARIACTEAWYRLGGEFIYEFIDVRAKLIKKATQAIIDSCPVGNVSDIEYPYVWHELGFDDYEGYCVICNKCGFGIEKYVVCPECERCKECGHTDTCSNAFELAG